MKLPPSVLFVVPFLVIQSLGCGSTIGSIESELVLTSEEHLKELGASPGTAQVVLLAAHHDTLALFREDFVEGALFLVKYEHGRSVQALALAARGNGEGPFGLGSGTSSDTAWTELSATPTADEGERWPKRRYRHHFGHPSGERC